MHARAKDRIDFSRLCMPMTTPGPANSCTSDALLHPAGRRVDELDLARLVHPHLHRPVEVAVGMAADDDGLFPAAHDRGDVAHDDRLAEDGAVEDGADLPFGDGHSFLSLYSFTRSASGVMVAHLTPTP